MPDPFKANAARAERVLIKIGESVTSGLEAETS
jgi:hypothetical protein